jgi:rhodanese-related sulfurtransferase
MEISIKQYKQQIAQGATYVLLDVREPYEHAQYHLTDLLIPLNELPKRLAELEPYREQPIVVYCQHGVRSLYATQYLLSQGFKQVYSLAGGVAAWLAAD